MRDADHDRTGRLDRHRRTALAAAGLVLLGSGAFLATGQMAGDSPATVGPADRRQASPTEEPAEQAGHSGAQAAQAEETGPAEPTTAAPAPSRNTTERLEEARGANRRLGTTVRRPVIKPSPAVDQSKVRTVENGAIHKNKRMMRIVSSRQDLTGFRELAWIAGEGKPYGRARCSRTIQMSEQKVPEEKPTLLMCWRTTPQKSVYTITVDLRKNPTPERGVAALEKEWARMG